MKKKLQVFISSTYSDLIEERQAAVEAILNAGHIPAGMELFKASNETQLETVKRWIDESDIYILIVGGRYGSIEPISQKSYTQLEYEYAVEKGMPFFSVVMNSTTFDKKVKRHGISVTEQENPTKLRNFKEIVTTRMCKFFDDNKDIKIAIIESINELEKKHKFTGWISGRELHDIEGLIRENKELKLRIEEYNTNAMNTVSFIPQKEDNLNLINYIDKFLNEKKRLGRSKITLNGYKIQLKLYSDYMQDKDIQDINSEDIKNFMVFREDNYSIRSTNSLESLRAILRVFFEWLVDEKVIDSNPVSKIKSYKVFDANVERLNNEEFNVIRKACKTTRQRALIEFLLSTGCKLDELKMIRKNHIDWNNKTVKIPGTGRRNRVGLLTDKASEYLKNYVDSRGDGLEVLFITERKPYRCLSNRGIQRDISLIIQQSGLEKKITTKTFRHTFARDMLSRGVPINIVQSLLGHTDFSSTSETYSKLTEDNIFQLLQK
ncbi:MAG TPA: DUF4062 domain-containing protein [Bacilli bacterium]